MPAINPEEFLKHQKPKRQIKPKQFTGYKSSNLVEKHSVNNDRALTIEQCKLKKSFFVNTIIEWNHLETAVVHAETVEGFKKVGYETQGPSPAPELSPEPGYLNFRFFQN